MPDPNPDQTGYEINVKAVCVSEKIVWDPQHRWSYLFFSVAFSPFFHFLFLSPLPPPPLFYGIFTPNSIFLFLARLCRNCSYVHVFRTGLGSWEIEILPGLDTGTVLTNENSFSPRNTRNDYNNYGGGMPMGMGMGGGMPGGHGPDGIGGSGCLSKTPNLTVHPLGMVWWYLSCVLLPSPYETYMAGIQLCCFLWHSFSFLYNPRYLEALFKLWNLCPCSAVGVLANREVMQALNTLAHFNNMTNGSLFGAGFGQVSEAIPQINASFIFP